MKRNKMLRLKIRYVKFLLKIYALIKSILPKFSIKLKRHIEKTSLHISQNIHDVVNQNNIHEKQ